MEEEKEELLFHSVLRWAFEIYSYVERVDDKWRMPKTIPATLVPCTPTRSHTVAFEPTDVSITSNKHEFLFTDPKDGKWNRLCDLDKPHPDDAYRVELDIWDSKLTIVMYDAEDRSRKYMIVIPCKIDEP
jgi:hypothetical protein